MTTLNLKNEMNAFLKDMKVLHVELTTGCNLRCPQCPRTLGDLPNPHLVDGELSLVDFKRLLPVELIIDMDHIFMCGNYGEPAFAKDCLEILRYIRNANPNITLGMNTNGSLRNEAWWREIASIMSGPLDYVVFSIDGLHDTNHIYRRDSNWSKIMKNATAFIEAGGKAQWEYLVFDHNKHQMEEAEALAREMGFIWFQCKETHRGIHPSVSWLKKVSDPFSSPISGKVSCRAKKEKSLFLTAKGDFYPCCYIGSLPDLRKDFGYRDIAASEATIETFKQLDEGTPNEVCKKFCSAREDGEARVRNQWTKITIFK